MKIIYIAMLSIMWSTSVLTALHHIGGGYWSEHLVLYAIIAGALCIGGGAVIGIYHARINS